MSVPFFVGHRVPPGMADVSHPLVARVYDAVVVDRLFGRHRAYLADGLSGAVLDLGSGTGRNLPYVDAAPDVTGVWALEPDPHMRSRAASRSRSVDVPVELVDGRAEHLPFPDDRFDAVLAGMVFCTIEDPDAALEEVVRVLAPGGEFRFFEHVHADGSVGTSQRVLEPAWRRLAGGCHLTRDSVTRFTGHPALDVLEIERAGRGVYPATPLVRGRLRKRA